MINRGGITPSIFNSKKKKRFNCNMPSTSEEIDLDKKLFPVYIMTERNWEERMCDSYTVPGYLQEENSSNQTDFLSVF